MATDIIYCSLADNDQNEMGLWLVMHDLSDDEHLDMQAIKT